MVAMKIAISGLSGSGNSTACEKVGNALKLKVINYTLRNLAIDVGMDFPTIQEKRKEDERFDLLLDKRQMEAFSEEKDAIIGSRLAIWMADANLRVWLDAPLEIRAERIAKREAKEPDQTLEETRDRDEENRRQYLKLYGIDVEEHGLADMVLDAGSLDADTIAERIIEEAGKEKYKNVRKSKYGVEIMQRIEKGLAGLKC
ncbi:MAG: (d)CMP kinase [Candidatus Micrarchaeota archaeon]